MQKSKLLFSKIIIFTFKRVQRFVKWYTDFKLKFAKFWFYFFFYFTL